VRGRRDRGAPDGSAAAGAGPAGARGPVRGVLAAVLLLAAASGAPAQQTATRWGTRTRLDLSGPGWTLALDPEARWEDEPLHAPGVPLADVARPMDEARWAALASRARPVAVPTTVEGELWPQVGDYRGVSWWTRAFGVPEVAPGQRVVLRFAAVRLRAEVYLDGAFVGYDAVGDSPFEVDVGDHVRPGGDHVLAVRVTDPGGNFDWVDHTVHWWGSQPIPPGHGFGGITGPVTLEARDALHVADVFVRNTPAVTDVEVEVELTNAGAAAASTAVSVELRDAGGGALVASAGPRGVEVPGGGTTTLVVPLSAPRARPWSPDDPALHEVRVALSGGDERRVRTGLRWFDVAGVGEDARLLLNGRPIVLRSAISWGLWPVTGHVPGPELAARQVDAARALGLNMLNHHRCAPAPGLLEAHDERGLLAHTEPGGYWCRGGDAATFALARAKWLRLVRRDRNHPSLVIRNMINEATEPPDARVLADLEAALRLDDTRVLTYTSAWAEDGVPGAGLHARPGRGRVEHTGWIDQHHAPGPGVHRDAHYRGPDDFVRRTSRRDAIVFLGEEAAIASPPRLERLVAGRDPARPGWDGARYRAWRDGYARFLEEKGLADAFGGLDALLGSMGDVALDHHARVVEVLRARDVVDGYVINGWESQPLENHSGIVDIERRVKGDGARLARANARSALVLRARRRVLHGAPPDGEVALVCDVWLVDETGRTGPHRLEVTAADARGVELARLERTVRLTGARGALLAAGLAPRVPVRQGAVTLRARLLSPDGRPLPTLAVTEPVLLARWRDVPVPAEGARWLGPATFPLRRFLEGTAAGAWPDLGDAAGAAAPGAVLVAGVDPEPRQAVPPGALRHPDEERAALVLEAAAVGRPGPPRVLETSGLDHAVEPPAWAGPAAPEGLELTWTGRLRPREDGLHGLAVLAPAGVHLELDGAVVLDEAHVDVPRLAVARLVPLSAGVDVRLRLRARIPPAAVREGARVALAWTVPSAAADVRARARALLDDVAASGASLLLVTHADAWARLLAAWDVLDYEGVLTMGRAWMGGRFFAREHAVFAGLPTGGAMGWPYQAFVHDDARRFGLRLSGEEVLAGCVSDHQPTMATAVGVVPHGRGRVLLSTLDVVGALDDPDGGADVARQWLLQTLAWGAGAAGR